MEKIARFTDRFIKNLQAQNKRVEYTEGGGFILRVSAKGVKTWVYSYSFERKAKRLKLGTYPAISLSEARKLHNNAVLIKERGIDPLQHERDKKEAIKKEKFKKEKEEESTIEWLAHDFFIRYVLLNRKAPIQIEQQIRADIIPLFGKYKIEEITTRDITRGLEKIVDRGSPIHANKVLRTIKQMFSYALSKGITERNPAYLIESKNVGGREIPRDRPLEYGEIKALWTFLEDQNQHNIPDSTCLGLKILLLTGVRTGSLLQAEKTEFNLDESIWTIPPEHLKLKKFEAQKSHVVHLSNFLKRLVSELISLSDSQYLIPNRQGDKPAHPKLFSGLIHRVRSRIKGIDEPFNVHDFRATISTHMAKLGIQPHIGELSLGHKLQGMLATYNKHDYLSERAKALQMWSDKIEMLVSNDNVVLMDRRA